MALGSEFSDVDLFEHFDNHSTTSNALVCHIVVYNEYFIILTIDVLRCSKSLLLLVLFLFLF